MLNPTPSISARVHMLSLFLSLWISRLESHTGGLISSRCEVTPLYYPLPHPKREAKVQVYYSSPLRHRDLALASGPVHWALKQPSSGLRLEHFCSVLLFLCLLESQNHSVSGLEEILKTKHVIVLNFHSVTTKGRINIDKDKNLPLM